MEVARNAALHVIQNGSGRPSVRSTVSVVVDGGQVLVIDPGMAPAQSAILDPLADLGFQPADVTDVVISHHHPDHTINVGLFGEARVHDHWAIYHHDIWTSRAAERFVVSPSVVLWETPGHTPQDISTLVGTAQGLHACTHLWFYQEGPTEDPYATDPDALHRNRRRVLDVAEIIVPGHGPPFTPSEATPR